MQEIKEDLTLIFGLILVTAYVLAVYPFALAYHIGKHLRRTLCKNF